MLKDHGKPYESAKKRAERRWKNHRVSKEFKAKKAEAKTVTPKPEEPLIIETERPKADAITRFENKFLRDIREMMEGHKLRNVELQIAINQAQRYKLLREKLRRLEARATEREGAAK